MNSTDMTEDQLIEQTIAAFAAWRKDQATHIQILLSTGWHPCDTSPPMWARSAHYRIKPAPKLRPWTRDEARGKWVRHKETGLEGLITSTDGEEALVNGHAWRQLHSILSEFTQLDGSPAGMQE